MNKQILNAFAKKFFVGNLMAAMMFLSANASVAPIRFKFEAAKVKKAVLTFKGTDNNDYLTFQISYQNPSASAFRLYITNESGEVIFSDTYQDISFSKTFKLQKEDVSKLNFTILDAKTGEVEKFNVNVNTEITEHVVVSRNN